MVVGLIFPVRLKTYVHFTTIAHIYFNPLESRAILAVFVCFSFWLYIKALNMFTMHVCGILFFQHNLAHMTWSFFPHLNILSQLKTRQKKPRNSGLENNAFYKAVKLGLLNMTKQQLNTAKVEGDLILFYK